MTREGDLWEFLDELSSRSLPSADQRVTAFMLGACGLIDIEDGVFAELRESAFADARGHLDSETARAVRVRLHTEIEARDKVDQKAAARLRMLRFLVQDEVEEDEDFDVVVCAFVDEAILAGVAEDVLCELLQAQFQT